MRENMGLYRGKRLENGEWVEGWLIVNRVTLDPEEPEVIYCYILAYGKGESYVTWYPVDPKTVGQYTGLTAKGKKIFEGDVVVAEDYVYVCQWNECNIEFELANEVESFGMCYVYPDVEVIGNIHDNPELLGGASK